MKSVSGWRAKRLLCLGFVPGNDETAFGFLDPAQVLRSIHLIPAFAWGRVTKCLPGSSPIARGLTEPDDDWQRYYVNMQVFISFHSFCTNSKFKVC
jgi:hypothetical protein